jgi:Cu-Zn family superoxide dismutase
MNFRTEKTMKRALSGVAAVLAIGCLAVPAMAKKHDKGVVIALKTSTGQDAGTATFRETKKDTLTIKLALRNLPPGDHAVHIHAKPLCEGPDFKTAGGHFNPDMKQHGTMNPMGHHAGDLPQNVTIGPDGTASVSLTVNYLAEGTDAANDILANGGTSIMVHEKPDDMKTDPTGNAGNRIACGVILEPEPTK